MNNITLSKNYIPAQQIIYENIYKKFDELLKNRNQLKDQVDTLYKDAYEKYSK